MRKIASFDINYLQYLDEAAKPLNDLPSFATAPDTLLDLYKHMQFLRLFDARAIALQRTGQLGTYPAALGQEAVDIGAGSCLDDRDVLVPYYRSLGAMMMHGVRPHEILLYWAGDERGSNFKDARAREDFPISVPIATQVLHAAGVANAFRLRGEKGRAVMTLLGEGGTSEGEFYEGLNIAGLWQLGMVIVVNNNQWAISVPSERQTAAATYAQKAIAAGVASVQIDGNDVIAVRDAVGRAMERARSGGGPTLVEAVTYRLCDHTTADDARRYRDEERHARAKEREPLQRLATFLVNSGRADERDFERIKAQCAAEIEEEVALYRTFLEEGQPPESMFDYLFAHLPEKTLPQRQEVIRLGAA